MRKLLIDLLNLDLFWPVLPAGLKRFARPGLFQTIRVFKQIAGYPAPAFKNFT